MNLKSKILKALTVEDWETMNELDKEDLLQFIDFLNINQESRYKSAQSDRRFQVWKNMMINGLANLGSL